MRKILRIIVSSPHELPFVVLNVLESVNKVDGIVLCEANYTHSGEKRQLIYGDLLRDLSPELKSRITYIPRELDRFVRKDANTEEDLHFNEQLIRNSFAHKYTLSSSDVVVSLDADEIIYASAYEYIFQKLKFSFKTKCVRLNLRQFFYRLNYHWSNCNFNSPVATRASVFLNNENAQWRDYGPITKKHVGVHFSWVMEVEQMAKKLQTYAHKNLYAQYAHEDTLRSAIKNKKYIFDDSVPFQIVKIDYDSPMLPKSVRQVFPRDHAWFDWN
jgi:hypothetical protein